MFFLIFDQRLGFYGIKGTKYLRNRLIPKLVSEKTCSGRTDWSTVYDVYNITNSLERMLDTSQQIEVQKTHYKHATW